MQRERLTSDRIRRFTCPVGVKQTFLWDTEAPRLAVRATAGAKSFIFESKLNRKTIRMTIGDVNAWGIEEARDPATGKLLIPGARQEARRLQTLVDRGIDPRQERAQRLAASEAEREAASRTEAPALEAWGAYVEARQGRWSARHLADHEAMSKIGGEERKRGRRPGEPDKTLPGALRPLLLLPLRNIDADQVRTWLKDEAAHRPTHARLAYGLLRAFLNWCADRPEYRGQVHTEACAARLARDELPKKTAKADCLQREQLPAWFAAVRSIPNPVIAAYLQALLLTGARREELTGLRWDDMDFRWQSLTIRDKVEGERTIPLTPYIAALLANLPRRNEWVFSSPTAASGRLQEPSIQHRKACAVAGIAGLTLHGLRRSFGTLAEWVECPAGVSAQIMGHKPSATAEKHYRVRPLDLLRMWHSKIEAWMLEQAGIPQPEAGIDGLHLVANNSKKAIL